MAETLVEPVAAVQSDVEPIAEPCPWQAAATLCRREWVRFVRQRNRVFGAIGQPLIFWLLLGAGFESSFQVGSSSTGGLSFFEYFFPGTLVLILLFTAIFATISVIEDRREGFLQSVLVAPIPRWSMVLGKLLGGTLIAVAQGTLFVLLGYTLHLHLGPVALGAVVAWMFFVALALTALGFVLAWRMDSTQGFHAVMMVLLMPMWLLSGAVFPAEHGFMRLLVLCNPLTYGVAGLRRLLYWDASPEVHAKAAESLAGLPPMWVCGVVTGLFCVAMFALAWRISAGRTTGDLL